MIESLTDKMIETLGLLLKHESDWMFMLNRNCTTVCIQGLKTTWFGVHRDGPSLLSLDCLSHWSLCCFFRKKKSVGSH